jgi:D-alanyl-lipoteichoic acid acyltransferase DltB (MBOAT superfamily)
MSFQSQSFLAFLAIVFAAHRIAGRRLGAAVLLAASFTFYAWWKHWGLVAGLALVIAAAYVGGLALGSPRLQRARSAVFWGSVVALLSTLFWFRYLPVVAPGLWFTAAASIGVSYFVFQAISYLVDVYSEVTPAERSLAYLALYLAYFPKLLQGPIERADALLPQLREPRAVGYEDARAALLFFAWGLAKKVLVADRLAPYVDAVYGDVHAHAGLTLVLATYLYAAQIYFDFSGYTDMALGVSRLFGIRLTQNFDRPYLATSVAEFWRRWHISFSRWILDYVFRPLQVSLRGWRTAGTALALVLTFLACGIWHGAGWTFVAWGLIHGGVMAFSLATLPLRKAALARLGVRDASLPRAARVAITFQLVCFAWIFFRAERLGDAIWVVTHLFSGVAGTAQWLLARGTRPLWTLAATGLAYLAISRWDAAAIAGERFRRLPGIVRWSAYYALAVALVVSLGTSPGRFIYFQF